MTYGLISDIHANIEALTAALAELTSVDAFLCMGDIVGYGPDPIACIDRLQSLPNLTCVAGNHDLAAIGRYSLDWFNDFARAAIEWTGERLTADAKSYLEGLDLTAELPDAFLVHGAYPDHMEYIVAPADAMGTFESMPVSPCFIGHTHVAEYYRNRKGARHADSHSALLGCSIALKPDLRYIVNPGSIGQPRDGNPDASFGIYDTKAQRLEIRRASYDIPAVQRKMREARLPQHLIDRLPRGR